MSDDDEEEIYDVLPLRYDYPFFCGDPLNFLPWKRKFHALVGQNDELTDHQKQAYLRRHIMLDILFYVLKEPKFIKKDGYNKLMNRLTEIYDSKKKRRSRLLELVTGLPAVTDPNDLSGMETLLEQLRAVLRLFREYEPEMLVDSSWLASLVEQKIPAKEAASPTGRIICLSDLKFQREVWLDKTGDSIEDLSTFLWDQLLEDQTLQSVKQMFAPQSQVDSSEHVQTERVHIPDHTPFVATSSVCTFCGGGHRPINCTVEMDVEARKSIVREKKGCYRCGKIGHQWRNCFLKKKCANCGLRHIAQMCDNKQNQNGGED